MNRENTQRGSIAYRGRAKQLIDYSGLKYGRVTPTDVDGLIEYQGRCFILYEFKYRDTELPIGQRIALERVVDNLNKPALLIVAEHDTVPVNDIKACDCPVREYYTNGRWAHSRNTVKELTDMFIHKHTSCFGAE